MPGECNNVNVDLAEAEPWKNDGSSDDILKPGIDRSKSSDLRKAKGNLLARGLE